MRGFGRIVVPLLAAGFSVHATAQHATAFDVQDGRRVYEGLCAACHGPDGNLIAGIDFSRGVYRRAYSDDELAATIMAGIPNTPMPPSPTMRRDEALRVVEYLRSMSQGRETTTDGDARRGRALFEGKRRTGELERSLLEPEAEVQPENRFYEVQPKSGQPVVGRLLNRDTYTVQLIDLDERLRSFKIADLREHGFGDTPMPPAHDKLSTQEIADVVSYLSSLRGDAAP
jgi:mono/diheme cytochrome c family protein